jgi:hypothetical protein
MDIKESYRICCYKELDITNSIVEHVGLSFFGLWWECPLRKVKQM